MIDRHLMMLRARDDIGAEEEAAIRRAVSGTRRVPKGQALVRAFEPTTTCAILVSGLAARVKTMVDGRSQITDVHTPGDFVDLHSFTLKHLDHDVTALTDCEFALVPHTAIQEITERYPHLTRVYWFQTNLDAALSREWELSLGRRDATERTANLFCELHVRLGLVGLAAGNAYDLALTQSDLSECLGLSVVHVNRTLMLLRNDGLIEFRGRRLSILNVAGLRQAARFDAGYLYLGRRTG